MGWTLSGVHFHRNNQPTQVYADGNNAAWVCDRTSCGHPILFTYLEGRIGSEPAHPTRCPKCSATYSLSPAFGSNPQPPKGDIRKPAPVMHIV